MKESEKTRNRSAFTLPNNFRRKGKLVFGFAFFSPEKRNRTATDLTSFVRKAESYGNGVNVFARKAESYGNGLNVFRPDGNGDDKPDVGWASAEVKIQKEKLCH